MKYFMLIWAGLWRKPLRTALTMLSIVVAFFLFGFLQGVNSAFAAIIERSKLDRLMVDSRFRQPLPLAYGAQIAAIPDVKKITQVAFLNSYYQEQKNFVGVIATNPAIWLAIRPEYQISADQLAATARLRTGVIISDWLAKHNAWKLGDQITVRTRVPQKNGSADWTFNVVGIMSNSEAPGENRIVLANYSYYDEGRTANSGTANRFLLRIQDAKRATQVAKQIDELFANSPFSTRTQSEQEQAASQLSTIGDVNFFTHAIIGAVFFTLLFLTGNTIAESVRERTAELAVLKTLGYSDIALLLLVIAEGLLLCTISALIGLATAAVVFPFIDSYIPTSRLPLSVVLLGVLFAVCIAFVSSAVPAVRAKRLNIVDALAVR